MAKMKEDYENGLSITQLSRKNNLSRSMVYNLLKKENTNFRNYSESQKGKLHSRWKGGKYSDSQGRNWITTENGQELEHRFLYKKYHNLKSIPEDMIVHHKDGNKKNNSKENLELMNYSEHHIHHNILRWKNKTMEVDIYGEI